MEFMNAWTERWSCLLLLAACARFCSTCCSCRGPEFCSHSHVRQLTTTSAPTQEHRVSLDLCRYLNSRTHTHTHYITHIHTYYYTHTPHHIHKHTHIYTHITYHTYTHITPHTHTPYIYTPHTGTPTHHTHINKPHVCVLHVYAIETSQIYRNLYIFLSTTDLKLQVTRGL